MAREIGIDYDEKVTKDYLRSVIHVINSNYKPSYIKLYISPSGRGYHIKFMSELELSDNDCLQIRDILGDDPYRISKLYRSDGTFEYRDVLFDCKLIDGKFCKVKRLDVDELMSTGREVEYRVTKDD